MRLSPITFFISTLLCAPAYASEALAGKYACTACHQAERRVVGPAWREIASKYADGSRTAAQLTESIKSGGRGKWGAVPMPAQPTVPQADALSLATWILQQRPQ